MKLIIVIAVGIILSAPTDANWEGAELKKSQTQSIRIDSGEDVQEGMLLMQTYRSGRPIYLVSLYNASSAYRTAMVTKEFFEKFYKHFNGFFKKNEQKVSTEDSCDNAVSVTLRVKKDKNQDAFCFDDLAKEEENTFSQWLKSVKAHLGA